MMIIDRLSLTAHRDQAQALMQPLVPQQAPRSRAEAPVFPASDSVSLSSGIAAGDQSWRSAEVNYPEGFPTEAREAMSQIALDPRVSFQDYALLHFKVLELPQAEAGLAAAGSSEAWQAQGSPRDSSVFANGFDLPSHLRRLMQEARNTTQDSQTALLQRLL